MGERSNFFGNNVNVVDGKVVPSRDVDLKFLAC
jgi:hypothetical protein